MTGAFRCAVPNFKISVKLRKQFVGVPLALVNRNTVAVETKNSSQKRTAKLRSFL